MLAFLVAACSQGGNQRGNEVAGGDSSAEASTSVDLPEGATSNAGEAGTELNESSTEAVSPARAGDVESADDAPASDQLWIGSVGGSGDEKCSRTTGGHIGSTPYIPVQQGQAAIISESSDVVILATTRVDNGKDIKIIFATSRTLCEAARRRAR